MLLAFIVTYFVLTHCASHSDFSEGLKRIEQNGKYGFVNVERKQVVHPVFEDAKKFSNGMAAVKYDGKWGYIDKEGTVVIPFKYYYATQFKDGVANVGDENWVYSIQIDKRGMMVLDRSMFKYDLFTIEKDGLYSIMNDRGETLIPFYYEDILIIPEAKMIFVQRDDKWGMFNEYGIEIIPCLNKNLNFAYSSPKTNFYSILDKIIGITTAAGGIVNVVKGIKELKDGPKPIPVQIQQQGGGNQNNTNQQQGNSGSSGQPWGKMVTEPCSCCDGSGLMSAGTKICVCCGGTKKQKTFKWAE